MLYLAELTSRLSRAAAAVPENRWGPHAAFLLAAQQADGGFAGRMGASDAYYTSFALRGLFILGKLDVETSRRAGSFLASRPDRPNNVVDLFAFLSSAMLIEVSGGGDCLAEAGYKPAGLVEQVLTPLCRPGGGVSKSTRSGASSTYHTFLAALCRELAGLPVQDAEGTARTLRARQQNDGGFVELPIMRRSGLNPTAAAVAVLRMLDALDEPLRDRAARFLGAMQTVEGGLRAHAVIPTADLLSTFTGLVALADLEKTDSIDGHAARGFVDSLALPNGGFLAATGDDRPDVEYTFYGIASTVLLGA